MDKIVKNEIVDSLEDTMKKRAVTPIYGVFLISWIIFHWKFVLSIFLVSEEKIWQSAGVLKIDYLSNLFFNYNSWVSYISWILPFIFTWLIIWKFPKLFLLPAFEKDEEYRIKKKIIRIKNETDLTKEQIKLELQNIVKLDTVEEKTKKEKELEELDPTIKWEKEYLELRETKHFKDDFYYIKDIIVKQRGFLSSLGELLPNKRAQGILGDYIFVLEAKGFLEISDNNNVITPTEKGKYIISRYIDDIQNYGPEKFGFKTGLNLG